MSRKPITTRERMREAVKAAFVAHIAAPADVRDSAQREHYLTLSTAIHLLAASSDADLRRLAREADWLGFTVPNLADAKQAAVRLARWQTLLAKQR